MSKISWCPLLITVSVATCVSPPAPSLSEQHQQIQGQVLAYLLDSLGPHGRVRVFCLGAVANGEEVDPTPTILRALNGKAPVLLQASQCRGQIPKQINAHNDTLALVGLSYRLDSGATSLDVHAIHVQGPLWASQYDCQLKRRGAWTLKSCRLASIS